ncbi:GNAT family N-acetyltransferase [Atlantibacter hermannii]|uniref:GNAT family N-acetyltransferase n=1 Tax=Atlantibacter hermannii TaxID=565 RepID=UPI0005C14A62|nr:GNAT family protein [Atlantibacter hermannii]KIU31729.1 GCN5 family acetyltransferase [Atlantibacter hermannii]
MQPADYITSARITYQQITPEDWPFFLALQRDPRVSCYLDSSRQDDTLRAAFECRLPRWEPGSRHWLCLVMREKTSGEPFGVTGFIDRGEGITEVGYLLATRVHGQGLGYESLHAVCDYAFQVCGYRKLVATVTVGNEPSRRVLEKAGFVLEGTLRENYLLDGRWQDDWLFGLLAREFTPG